MPANWRRLPGRAGDVGRRRLPVVGGRLTVAAIGDDVEALITSWGAGRIQRAIERPSSPAVLGRLNGRGSGCGEAPGAAGVVPRVARETGAELAERPNRGRDLAALSIQHGRDCAGPVRDETDGLLRQDLGVTISGLCQSPADSGDIPLVDHLDSLTLFSEDGDESPGLVLIASGAASVDDPVEAGGHAGGIGVSELFGPAEQRFEIGHAAALGSDLRRQDLPIIFS